jgi:hypothetical protein
VKTRLPRDLHPGHPPLQGRGVAALVDFSDAFARVSATAVAWALQRAGAPPYAIHVLTAWLSNRSFRVRTRDAAGRESWSDPAPLARGCPQGSILGPFLWNLVVDDLLRKLRATIPPLLAPETGPRAPWFPEPHSSGL